MDLPRRPPGSCQHENSQISGTARTAGVGDEPVEDGECEYVGLAAACHGTSQKIPAAGGGWDGNALDWGVGSVAGVFDATKQGWMQAEFGERHGVRQWCPGRDPSALPPAAGRISAVM